MQTKKELFTKYFNAHQDFELATNTLLTIGIHVDESMLFNAFYAIFDTAMDQMFTEEGLALLYEHILFQDYSIEEAFEELEEHLI